MGWDGEDRRNRSSDREMHDMVIRIDQNVQNMMAAVSEQKKEQHDAMEKHEESDEKHFTRLYGMHGTLKWYVGIGLGVTLAAEFFLAKLFKG